MKLEKFLTEEKDDVRNILNDVWKSISEIVPSARAMGIQVKVTELVPLRKELEKLEKILKSRIQ